VITTQVRPAVLRDQQRLSNLIFFETRSHRHLDWRSPLEWLGDKYFWTVEEGIATHSRTGLSRGNKRDRLGAAFCSFGAWSADNAWTVLWNAARQEIARAGGAKVAAIVQHSWFQKVLEMNGFNSPQSIVMLEWSYQPWAPHEADGVRIRSMTEADLPNVTQVDNAAFDPLWHNSQDTLRRALSQSMFATVAEDAHGVVGYQIATGAGTRAHLARLAVSPSVQGRGVGGLCWATCSGGWCRTASCGCP
jgi:hypothetical protein